MRLMARLAMADLWGERVLALCSIVGAASVLAPLLVLAGLRAGVIEDLRQHLLQNPHAREIVTISNRAFSAATLRGIAGWHEVGFLAPRTRTLAAELLLSRGGIADQAIRVEVVPSGSGDPLLARAPERADEIVLSKPAADRLNVVAGATLHATLTRRIADRSEAAVLDLHVMAVASASAYERPAVFATPGLASVLENYQDGLAALPATLRGATIQPRAVFAGFRLYAAGLEQVPALDGKLRGLGIDVASRAGDIANLMLVDRNLTLLFLLVAGLGGSGFLISLGAGLWANTARKRQHLALLRLLGVTGRRLQAIPVMQAALLAACGAGLGIGAACAASAVINVYFTTDMMGAGRICLLGVGLIGGAFLATVAGAILMAAAAARYARAVQPWEGVRTS